MQAWKAYCKTFVSPAQATDHDTHFNPTYSIILFPRCNFSSFPPTTLYMSTSSPMATSISSREEAGSQKKKEKEPGGKSTNMSLLPTTSQPSPLTRGREEEGGKQKHNAPESSIPRTVAFFVTKQQRMDARDALRRFGGQSRSSRHFLWFYLPGTSLESPGQIQKGPYPCTLLYKSIWARLRHV